ncbi:MAG: hypothetical protein M0Z34_05010 [Nitrospiraceae bacterium]|nr:hypothetical protein [Nitrospiraceae bacterium]
MIESVSASIMAPTGPRRLSLGWESAHRPSPSGRVAFVSDLSPRPRLVMPLAEHVAGYGRLPSGLTMRMALDTLRASNLTGRGGAGFPFWKKLQAVATAESRKSPVVIANGSESEPLSKKDTLLLKNNPHLVLDGISMIAGLLGAKSAYLYVKDREAHTAVNAAMRERRERGISELRVTVVEAPAGYVSGQETAVVRRIAKGPALPQFSLDRISTSGVRGAPTLLSNVETFAQVAIVLRFGADWYQQGGQGSDRGTRLLTLVGAVGRPGVYELLPGATLAELLREADAGDPRAVLVGGYFGRWVDLGTPNSTNFPMDDQTLAERKLSFGAGIFGVVGHDTCPVVEAAAITEYLAGQSAGQCGPCMHGLPEISTAMARIALSSDVERGMHDLRAVIPLVEHRGGCQHPDGVIQLVRSTVGAFAEEVKLHRSGRCTARGSHTSVLLPPGATVAAGAVVR